MSSQTLKRRTTSSGSASHAFNYNSKLELPAALKYKLYSSAVQSPADTVKTLRDAYRDNFGENPMSLREDFCGTFLVGCEWVQNGTESWALGIDLDPETISFARRNMAKLRPRERARAKALIQDVRVPSIPRVDVIAAENFSFYIFKQRTDLVKYFRAAYRSLNNNAILTLDMIGGPGFVNTPHDSRKTLKESETGLPCPVIYRWKQRQFNAITNEAKYSIDFKIKDHWYNDTFSYDWRVWSISEVQDALVEAGFSAIKIYCEDKKAKETSIKPVQKIASEWDTWACLVVAIKSV